MPLGFFPQSPRVSSGAGHVLGGGAEGDQQSEVFSGPLLEWIPGCWAPLNSTSSLCMIPASGNAGAIARSPGSAVRGKETED